MNTLASYLIANVVLHVHAALLPSFLAGNGALSVAELEGNGKWWARAGNHVYYSPPASLGLSQRINDYYYVIGSQSALTDEMHQHRVGGEGRLHIFHLPNGPSTSMLQATATRSRRSSISQFSQLKSGMELSTTFPAYAASATYQNPLDANGQELERTIVAGVTASGVESYLTTLTSLPNVSAPSRSSNDLDASEAAVQFIKGTFESLGLTTCVHEFNSLKNVVGFIQGSSPGTVTVGAHYDSIPAVGKAPGAEDNGSGVAALLAMLASFSKAKFTPTKSIYFVAFAGEEQGMLGSGAFARELVDPTGAIPEQCRVASSKSNSSLIERMRLGGKKDIGRKKDIENRALGDLGHSFLQTSSSLWPMLEASDQEAKMHKALIMDEVGWLSPSLKAHTVNIESYDWSADVMEHLAQSSRTHNGVALQVVHNNAPFGSDHMSWLSRNMHAALTINGDDEAYPNYHQSTDTINNVNFDYVAQIAKMNIGALVRLTAAP